MTFILSFAAVLLAAIFILGVLMAIFFRRVVPTNMVNIVQTAKKTTPYGRDKPAGNTYYAWPSWVPRLGITVTELPESNFQVKLTDYEAYDMARLPFIVDVTAFFRIDEAELAAQRVPSYNELKLDLHAVLQGAVRRILATNTLEDIMQSRSTLGDQFTLEVKDQIAEWGVIPVKTIEFMDLRDSAKGNVIQAIMAKEQSRIDRESRVSVADNNRSAMLAEIDAKRVVDVRRQDAEQQVGQRTAEKEQVVGIARENAQQEVLTASKITADRTMDVLQLEETRRAEISREVAAVKAEQDKNVAVVNAEAEKQTQVVKAEGEKDALVLKADGDRLATVSRADGDLHAAKTDAEGIRARGEATAAAEQASLLAPVNSQITLAKEIGGNDGYQKYLVTIAQVDAGREVGVAMAKSLEKADLKVIANSGDVQQGVASLGDLLTPAGGTKLTGMLAALGQTAEGKALLGSLTGSKLPALVGGAAVAGAVANAVTS
jgi:flotillin